MAQQDILRFLKSSPENWFTAKQIKEMMRESNKIYSGLRKLREYKLIRHKTVPKRGAKIFVYRA